MTIKNFEFLYIIGRGGFGKVWKVKYKQNNKSYALKQMSKVKIIDKKSIKSINSERDLLSELYSPFIVNMHYAFQDKEYLYLIMDYLPGGDLRYHISIHKKFSEEQTRFFICGIILSLEYIHSMGVIHRDIKPENLVLDEKGYVRITDFGIAKKNMEDNSSETSGTPGYMSPEVINSKNHSFPADYFALGVIGYEFMKGERPYNGKNRKEIKDEINSRQAEIIMKENIKNNYKNVGNNNNNDDMDINDGDNWSKESIYFINKLLMRNPEQRLGYKGINELKEHSWLRYYPWDLIENKTLPSPFIPNDKGNFDSKYCKGVDYIGEETQLRYEEIFSEENYDACFKDFYYNIDEDKKRNNEIISSLSNNKEKDKFEYKRNNNNNKNKDGLNNLSLKLNNALKNFKDDDENLKKKLDSLKKHVDNKVLELNTKLELFLNNIGGTDKNGESTLEKKFDLSALNDFMQKLITLENKFDDFVSTAKINYVHDQIKYLDEEKADKNEMIEKSKYEGNNKYFYPTLKNHTIIARLKEEERLRKLEEERREKDRIRYTKERMI